MGPLGGKLQGLASTRSAPNCSTAASRLFIPVQAPLPRALGRSKKWIHPRVPESTNYRSIVNPELGDALFGSFQRLKLYIYSAMAATNPSPRCCCCVRALLAEERPSLPT